ncbi:mRNA capping beta chain, putative [Bodo saltans]|uniref:mRNA 5'-phosphatase n=1 Tax=Bodo saltans TaxID=75058 RepID=A0A0S4JKB2_BODSA|nr:mRNA capping beta chain, putative [Bodo saltans]|eukprot:CUG91954.1 mRNA capping beta chain, putative [Bodo saltans]
MESRKRSRSPDTQPAENDSATTVPAITTSTAPETVKRLPTTTDQLVMHLFKAVAPHLQKPNLELEVRLCILCDERNQRFRVPIETPAVVTKVKKAEASVAKYDFERIVRVLEEALASAVARAEDGVTPAMKKRETNTRDVVRNGIRESFDPVTGVSLGIIKKQRLVVCDILCPRSRYDLRFALNQEVPIAPSTVQASGGGDSGFVRMKQRTSFEAGPYSFDLTQVRQRVDAQPSLEVEIEAALDSTADLEKALSTVSGLLAKAFSLLEKV